MSLLDDLFQKALQAASNAAANTALDVFDDKTPEGFDRLINAAIEKLPSKEGLDKISLGARNGAEEALKLLQKRKDKLVHLGRFGLVVMLSNLAVGRTKEAQEIYLRKKAGLGDLLAESLANDNIAIEQKKKLDEAKQQALDEALSILREIGSLTARYALPALLAIL